MQFKIKNGTNVNQTITSVSALSDERDGLDCDRKVPPEIVIKPNETAAFNCTRSYVDVSRNGETFAVLPGGTITFSSPLTGYLYSFKERFKKDISPEPDVPPKFVVSLEGAHIRTNAYWAGGRRLVPQYCSDDAAAHLDAQRPGFDLVVDGTYEKQSSPFGRGLCGKPPVCDSHNEFCRELYYRKACYINTAWHDWYKREMTAKNIAYSKESVCAPP